MADKQADPRRRRRLRQRAAAVAGFTVVALVVMVIGSLGGTSANDDANTPGFRGTERVMDTTPFTMVPSDGDSPVTLPDDALVPDATTTAPPTTAPPTTTTTLAPLPTTPESDPQCEVIRRVGLVVSRIQDRSESEAVIRLQVLDDLRPIPDLLTQAADPRLDDVRALWVRSLDEAAASPSLDGVIAAVQQVVRNRGETTGGLAVLTDHVAQVCPQLGLYLQPRSA